MLEASSSAPESPPMLLLLREHEVHELEVSACPLCGGAPGLPGLVAVVHCIHDDIVAPPKIQLSHRTGRLVGNDPDLPPSRQAAGKERVLDRVDREVDRRCARSDDLGDARLPAPGRPESTMSGPVTRPPVE